MMAPRGFDNAPASRPTHRIRFILVGLLGFFVDMVTINLLYSQDFSLSFAHILSFLTASAISYFLNFTWSFKDTIIRLKSRRFIRIIVIILLILFLRGGILATLIQLLDFSPGLAFFICITASAILNYMGNIFYGFSQQSSYDRPEKEWYYFFVGIIIYSILLRLFYLGVPELFYEEAYYWNYAKHLDIGYLDHPPMVAWMIGLFTKLMGDNEFAVRFGAFVCWFITAYFSYRLTRDIDNRSSTGQATLLVATLPAFFAIGWVMTPDAPLVACWAAALYFLYQALIHDRPMAWAGVGISIGLGMLSKYTMALLGPAALLFILIDRHSRKWLFRPEPYLAIILAIIIFSPVIVWNAGHEWVSFLYQGRDRAAERFEFSLPYFIFSIILIITPTGFLSVIAIILYRRTVIFRGDVAFSNAVSTAASRGYYLLMILTLLPVIVLGGLSLFRETKFHWTTPCWLGIVPFMALIATRDLISSSDKWVEWVRRAWPATIMICLISYGAVLHYLGPGFPGVPYPRNLYLLGWQGFGREIEALVERVEHETGEKILVVGMDRNRLASGLAFYRTKAIEASNERIGREPAFQTSSWHLFGGNSLMYEYWFPIEDQNNKTLLLVSRSIANLTSDNVFSHVRQAGDIKEIILWKNGKPAGRYYYCLVKGYQNERSEYNTPSVISSD